MKTLTIYFNNVYTYRKYGSSIHFDLIQTHMKLFIPALDLSLMHHVLGHGHQLFIFLGYLVEQKLMDPLSERDVSYLFSSKVRNQCKCVGNGKRNWLMSTWVSMASTNTSKQWWSPPQDIYKLNYDVSWENDGRIGLGVVYKDELGLILFTRMRQLQATQLIEMVEVMTMCFGLQLTCQVDVSRVRVEGDF